MRMPPFVSEQFSSGLLLHQKASGAKDVLEPAYDPAMAEASEFGRFLLVFGAALFGAKLLGEIAHRLGQPAVLGELVAGVLLGPSVLGLVALTPSVHLAAEIGVVLLLFEVGLETDLEELMAVGGP